MVGNKKKKKQGGGNKMNRMAGMRMVPYVAQPKKQKRRVNNMRSMDTSAVDNENAWRIGAMDVFNPSGRSSRLPGDNRLFTNTYFRTGTINVAAGTNMTTGCIFVSPNPITALVDVSRFNGSYTAVNASGMQQYPTNAFLYECGNGWGTLCSNIRLTNIGWKLRNTQPYLSVTGRLMIAPIPDVEKDYGYQILNNNTLSTSSLASLQLLGGYSPGVLDTSAVLQIPGSREYSFGDILGRDILLRSKIVSDDVYRFKNCTAGATASFNNSVSLTVDAIYTASTGVVTLNSVSTDSADLGKYGVGWTGFVIYYEGIPAAATPVFDVEYMYCFEGQPAIASSNDNAIPSTPQTNMSYSRVIMDRVLAYAANLNWQELITSGAVLAGRVAGVPAPLMIRNT